jgi:hypothetical protein
MSNKTESFRVRVTADENNAFKQLADKVGESRSRLARKFVREALNNEIDLLTDEQLLLKVVIRQLTGIANNLNQITKAMHTGIVPTTIDLNYLVEIRGIALAVRNELITIITKSKKRWMQNHASQ